jgi:glucose/arabinose dehydrogenase
VPFPTNPDSVVDPASARELMRIAKPQFNHNGGAVNFGPDHLLYIATGDGGEADDQGAGHTAQGNGQDTSNLLGKILRIDPQGNDAANGQYSVPLDNPFAPSGGAGGGQDGCLDGECDEIYAFGFRNPFRFSFDRKADLLIAADVGQNDIEEVDVVVSGGNYGWRHKEGTFFFDPNGDGPGFVTDVDPGVPPGLIDPIAQYDHDEGLAIIGGFVYRGDDIPRLRGRYVFGEFARTFSNDGRLFHLTSRRDPDRGDNLREIREFHLVGQDQLGLSLLGFGEDAHGELYVLANSTGTPFGETGVVLKVALPRGDDMNNDDRDDD